MINEDYYLPKNIEIIYSEPPYQEMNLEDFELHNFDSIKEVREFLSQKNLHYSFAKSNYTITRKMDNHEIQLLSDKRTKHDITALSDAEKKLDEVTNYCKQLLKEAKENYETASNNSRFMRKQIEYGTQDVSCEPDRTICLYNETLNKLCYYTLIGNKLLLTKWEDYTNTGDERDMNIPFQKLKNIA